MHQAPLREALNGAEQAVALRKLQTAVAKTLSRTITASEALDLVAELASHDLHLAKSGTSRARDQYALPPMTAGVAMQVGGRA